MHPMMPLPYHHGLFRRPLEVFDPFSLFFWDPFPYDFPAFQAPPFMTPPLMAPPFMSQPHMPQSHMSQPHMPQPHMSQPHMAPPRMLLPQMRELVPRAKIEHKETSEAHLFIAKLPGMRKEDVTVKVDEGGRMLHIIAKRKHEIEENKEQYHHVERGCGEFVSKFMLPPDVKPEQLRSCVDNGVLTITIPKQKQHQPQSNYY